MLSVVIFTEKSTSSRMSFKTSLRKREEKERERERERKRERREREKTY